jgi:hypothetical protein
MGGPAWSCKARTPARARFPSSSSVKSTVVIPLSFWTIWFPFATITYSFQSSPFTVERTFSAGAVRVALFSPEAVRVTFSPCVAMMPRPLSS